MLMYRATDELPDRESWLFGLAQIPAVLKRAPAVGEAKTRLACDSLRTQGQNSDSRFYRLLLLSLRSTVPAMRPKPISVGRTVAKVTTRPTGGTDSLSVSTQSSGTSETWMKIRSAGRSPAAAVPATIDRTVNRPEPSWAVVQG